MNLTTAQARQLGLKIPPVTALRNVVEHSKPKGKSPEKLAEEQEKREEWERSMKNLPGVFIPIRVRNPLNSSKGQSRHWWGKSKEAKAARTSTCFACMIRLPAKFRGGKFRCPPICVTMTRYGVGTMDEGCGLNASLKPVRDGVADAMGLKDNDPRIEWVYRQEKAKHYGVRILVEAACIQTATDDAILFPGKAVQS